MKKILSKILMTAMFIFLFQSSIMAVVGYPVTFSISGANGTISATANGSTITSGETVYAGYDVVFTAVPALGYHVKSWS